ncbi:hypothetical protein BJF78_25535 [Pseudonocardia sp. CNS-139]|nr:hypothetical protein BJF78_25535 [Pseudonocardia sp. CNS-139]
MSVCRASSARSWLITSSAPQRRAIRASTSSASSVSNALVGSSARVSSGSCAVAATRVARCSIPPDHWCGRWRIRWSASPMPTASSNRATVPGGGRRRCAAHASVTWWATVRSGSHAANGSWGTCPTTGPRSRRSSGPGAPTSSRPPTRTLPSTRVPAGSRPSTARARVVLPLPERPTTPHRSPGPMRRVTSWRARWPPG